MINKTHTGKHRFTKRFAAILLTGSIIFSLCACSEGAAETISSLSPAERKESLAQAKNDKMIRDTLTSMLGFAIDESLIEEAEMTYDKDADTYGKFMILIKEGKDTDVYTLLKDKCGDFQNIDASLIPTYNDNQYAIDLRQMKFIKHFVISRSDAGKSATINIYLAQKGMYHYLFIFG